jgi:PAS domain S-box-containing protein
MSPILALYLRTRSNLMLDGTNGARHFVPCLDSNTYPPRAADGVQTDSMNAKDHLTMSSKESPVPDSHPAGRIFAHTRRWLLRYDVLLLILTVLLLFLWPRLWQNLFSDDRFMPHGMCYLWIPQLVSLHLISDSLIGLSYLAISATLTYLVYKARRDIPFRWVFLAFGLFIVTCGATHFMEVWTIWQPVFWLSGYVKLVTAVASVATAVVLPPLIPKVLELINSAKLSQVHKAELESANTELNILRKRERRHAEEKLRQNESELAEAQRLAHIGNWNWDLQSDTLSWSDEHFRLLGLDPQEFTPSYEAVLKYTHPDDRGLVTSTVENALRTQESFSFYFRVIQPGGKERVLHSRGDVISDERGNSIGVFGTAQDVTDLRQAEENLRHQLGFTEAITSSLGEGLYALDLEGRVTFMNPAASAALGWKQEELLGQKMHEVIHFQYADGTPRSAAECQILKVLRSPNTCKVESDVFTRKDRSLLPVSYTSSPISTGAQIIGAVLAFHDITERTLAEESLRQSEERYRLLFERNPQPMWVFDVKTLFFLEVNEAAIHHYGYSREEFLLMTIKDIRPSEDVPNLLGALSEGTPQHQNAGVWKHKKKDGTIIDVEIAAHELTFFGRSAQMVLANDVTERGLLEAQLRQSQKMEAIGTLAGGVAHDFNNLLTAILGNTQLAVRNLAPDDPLQLRLIEVEKAGNRAAVLTRQLLAFSRRQHLERRTINVNETIGEIMKLLQRIIGEDVEVLVKYTSALCAVFADPVQIEQVIMNLGVNARDAMPEGGQLTIETSNVELNENYRRKYPYAHCGKYVEIRVSDTGIGMDDETQAHIFEPFYTTKEVGHGTGLGLSMVYGIVKQHDGHINVYSEKGHGATFKIYLPVVESADDEDVIAVQPPLLGGTETILVAEDEEALRNLARDILEGLGYAVLLAPNGEEAVEIFGKNREQIDLLLLDVVMPRMGGWEAYERIRELDPDVPLILMTGYSAETVQNRFVKQIELMERLGATVLQKPYNVEGLGRKVREVLDKSE